MINYHEEYTCISECIACVDPGPSSVPKNTCRIFNGGRPGNKIITVVKTLIIMTSLAGKSRH